MNLTQKFLHLLIGGYEVTSATCVLAHTTQFAPIGWRYTKHFQGVQVGHNHNSFSIATSLRADFLSVNLPRMQKEGAHLLWLIHFFLQEADANVCFVGSC